MYLQALVAMGTVAKSTENLFLALASQAMVNDLFTLTMRVMDKTKRAASFWYLIKAERAKLDTFTDDDLKFIEDASCRLSHARNKAHAHADKNYAYKSDQAWKEADISGFAIERLLNLLYTALCSLFEAKMGFKFDIPRYDFEDVKIWIRTLAR